MPLVPTIARASPPILFLAMTCSWKWSTMISALRRIAWSWPSDEAPQLLLRLLDVELRVVLHRLGKPVVAGHRRVVRQHVQDEPLLDCLLHGVAVEGVVPDRAAWLRVRLAEDLQRLVLRGGGEREVAGVREQLARLHQAVDVVLGSFLLGPLHRLSPARPRWTPRCAHPGWSGPRR